MRCAIPGQISASLLRVITQCVMLPLMRTTPLPLIGSAEACRILGDINRSTLTRWVADGELPAAGKLPGKNGAFLFDRGDVEALAAQRHKASA